MKTIYERRAVRKYKPAEVSKDLVEQVISAGRMAPSAMNRQPWKFYVVTDRKLIHSFSSAISKIALKQLKKVSLEDLVKMTLSSFHLTKLIDFLSTSDHIFHNAPVVIFITAPKDDEWAPLDIGMCAQNIMLAAKATGLDTCPVGFGKFVMQANDYYKLNIPATEIVLLSVVLGYGDEQPPVHDRIGSNVSYF